MNESLRQIIHLVFGLAIAVFVLAFDRELVVAALMLALFVGFILSDALSRGYAIPLISEIIANLERRDAAPGKGALFFALGALFCLVFFDQEIVFLGLVVLSLLDSITTLIGVRFGRTRIYNHKTLEGTAAGIAVTAAALCLFAPPAIALVTAAAAGLTELASPVDDNLVIPVAVCLVLTMLV